MKQYDALLSPARALFDRGWGLRTLLAPGGAAEQVERFLMHFSALGVGMTEPVEGWIRRAGDACAARGLAELGDALRAHAGQEAGHEQMMIDDTRALVARWNRRRAPALDADRLLALPLTPGVVRYRQLHEAVIGGDAPYGQLAIEYEIEMLSVRVGPVFVRRCIELAGRDITECLSFIHDHVALDAGHTRFNERQLRRLLAAHPDFLVPLATAGAAALAAYGQFLDDCMEAALARIA